MKITGIFGIGLHGHDVEGSHGHRRRLFTLSGSVLLAGAIVLSPTFISQASASALPALEAGTLRTPAQVNHHSGPSDCPPADAYNTVPSVLCQGFHDRKDICKATEDQLNTLPGWKLNNCRFMP